MAQEKYGIDQIEKALTVLCEVVNVGEAIIAKKTGPLMGVLSLADDLVVLPALNIDLLKAQIGELSVTERARLRDLLKAKLVFTNKELEAKIESSADLLDEVVELGRSLVAAFDRAKKILGIA